MIGFISLFLFLSMMIPGAADTALKFSDDKYSVVSFPVDMSPLVEQFSFCVWVKRIRPGDWPVVFAYEESELFLYATGAPKMFKVDMPLSNNKPPMSTWYHYCGTWSLASKTFKGYINGALVVTQTIPARFLKTSGNMVLGDYWNPYARGASYNDFGGEMFNLNFFSNELTGGEVAAMSKDGLCTQVGFDDTRVIKWEELLTKPKMGNVQDISLDCPDIKDELENSAECESDLSNIKAEMENIKLELQEAKKELENGAKRESDLKTIKTELEKELANVPECDLQKGKLTRWDVLYSCNFYKKTFTRKLQKKFRKMWSKTKGLFGEQLTDEAIEKFKDLHKQADDNCGTD
ncbi:uncharacterized protein LOC134819915 [Bolinopsis microptera]|uniref:uncharacterized protein LOC134819915 n=1 Tax=Bolinopsis microptera TaxID=2820187 RepID=UPI0030791509